jgi:hypothetical protein
MVLGTSFWRWKCTSKHTDPVATNEYHLFAPGRNLNILFRGFFVLATGFTSFKDNLADFMPFVRASPNNAVFSHKQRLSLWEGENEYEGYW